MNIAWGSDELIVQYKHLSSGHFFDKDNMRFFNSRITSNYRRLDDNSALFITTEKFSSDATRKATVRLAKLVKYVRESDKRECYRIDISTVGGFNSKSLHQAKKFMETYAKK